MMVTAALVAFAVAADAPELTHLRAWYAGMAAPARLALDASDNLYISDPSRREIVVRAPSGELLDRFAVGRQPVGVAVTGDGVVLVGDTETGSVRGYDAARQLVLELGGGAGEFGLPGDLAVEAATGDIWVADGGWSRVGVYASDGTQRFVFDGSPGEALVFPSGLWLVEDGVWVADQRGRRLRRFDRDGVEQIAFGAHGDSDGELYMPGGLWVAGGRVFVADARLARVLVFDEGGTWLGTTGGYGTRPGQLRLPSDLVVDASGRLFVASGNNRRIEMWGLDDYADPERYVVAEVQLEPRRLERDAPPVLAVRVEVEGHRPEDLRDLALNGVPPLEQSLGDTDHDRIRDLSASFDGAAVLATLPASGTGTARVTARVGDLEVDVSLEVEVIEATGDTGDTGQVDTGPGDTGSPAETGDTQPRRGCGCSTTGQLATSLVPLLLLAGRVRRRR